jgi:hypothetical protein
MGVRLLPRMRLQKKKGVKNCAQGKRCKINPPPHLPPGFHCVSGANDRNVRLTTRAAVVACAVALGTPPITIFGSRGGVGLVLLSPWFLLQGSRLKRRVKALMRIHDAAANNAGSVLLGPCGEMPHGAKPGKIKKVQFMNLGRIDHSNRMETWPEVFLLHNT